MAIPKELLTKLYLTEKLSVSEISRRLKYSERAINYWLGRHEIKKRTISEAIYLKYNPNGDPFKIKTPSNLHEAELMGLGLGLYWGEGNKRNRNSIKLGNTDPNLIKKFIEFLDKICGVDKRRFRFGLQIFSDVNPKIAYGFWLKQLKFPKEQFYKTVVTPARSIGTYHHKNIYGVLTVYFHNIRLRNLICNAIDNMK